jgi:hypothetical protein
VAASATGSPATTKTDVPHRRQREAGEKREHQQVEQDSLRTASSTYPPAPSSNMKARIGQKPWASACQGDEAR